MSASKRTMPKKFTLNFFALSAIADRASHRDGVDEMLHVFLLALKIPLLDSRRTYSPIAAAVSAKNNFYGTNLKSERICSLFVISTCIGTSKEVPHASI
jgi:hypothetical protein